MKVQLEMKEMQARMRADKKAKEAKAASIQSASTQPASTWSESTVVSAVEIMKQFDNRIRRKIPEYDGYEPAVVKKFKEQLINELVSSFDGSPDYVFGIGIKTNNLRMVKYDFGWEEGETALSGTKIDAGKITRVGMRTFPEMIHMWTQEVINEFPCFVSKLKQVKSHMDTDAKYAHYVRITISEKYLNDVRKEIYGKDAIISRHNHDTEEIISSTENESRSYVAASEDNIVPTNPDNKKKPHKKSGKKHHKK